MTRRFESEQHALYAGVVLGLAARHGLAARPRVDDQGNYLPEFNVTLDGVTVTLVIPPPADGWTLDGRLG